MNRLGNPIAVSTYSFWQFRREEYRDVHRCIELAAASGFDGVELLHRQLESEDRSVLQRIKRHAFTLGLPLCGLSIHQGFVSPDPEVRRQNVEHTRRCIELAYSLGIPTVRVNTGRWGTIPDFDALMANRGIEPILPGCTEDDGFAWVEDSLAELLPFAEQCGVVLGMENHWGLARTADGLLRIVQSMNSPWVGVTMDTGNFLEDTMVQLEQIAPHTTFVQAKTYFGGGIWYSLDLDYDEIASLWARHGYQGWISLEYEGTEDPGTAIPRSLEWIRGALGRQARSVST